MTFQVLPPGSGRSGEWVAAQTNVMLYQQLHQIGYGSESLARVRAAYELATELFAGLFRACGRPFLAHLVGTASILAEIGAAESTVVAGLLHAAYEQGDFGFTRWRNRRGRVKAVVGTAVEEVIQRYNALKWTKRTIFELLERLDRLSDLDNAVLLMRLANELEDRMNLAHQLSRERAHDYLSVREIVVAMADRLEQPRLAVALRRAFEEATDSDWLAPLRTDRKASYQLAWRRGTSIRRMLRFVPTRYIPF